VWKAESAIVRGGLASAERGRTVGGRRPAGGGPLRGCVEVVARGRGGVDTAARRRGEQVVEEGRAKVLVVVRVGSEAAGLDDVVEAGQGLHVAELQERGAIDPRLGASRRRDTGSFVGKADNTFRDKSETSGGSIQGEPVENSESLFENGVVSRRVVAREYA